MSSTTAADDRARLYLDSCRPFYHPVATLAELQGVGVDEFGFKKVLGKELLGERIVLAELDGRVVALHGTCPHRSANLALGWVNAAGDAVACAYHGFEWAANGRIHCIPALQAEGHPLPTGKAWQVKTYPTEVRYGLIWVCLDANPRFPILDVPEADDPFFTALPIAERVWQAGLGRIVEASLDTYHFAFAHRATIGDPKRPEAPKSTVTISDRHFAIEYDIVQPDNATVSYNKATSASGPQNSAHLVSHYQFWAVPNAVHLLKSSPKAHFSVLVGICPIGPQSSKLYRILWLGQDMDVDPEAFSRTQDRINREDQIVVESMRPWELSTDLDAELQAYVDRPTVAYRRWLAGMGIQFL